MGITKISRPWCGKKDNLPSFTKKEQHLNRKSKEELIHRWQESDWEIQYKEYLIDADQSFQE